MPDLDGHVPLVHENCDLYACQFCDGGLFACTVCDAFEGATPDQCPGRRMTIAESGAVYRGRLNFRDGRWRQECCAVMRPIHDKAGFMADMGYVHIETEHGGSWVKKTAPEVTGVNE
jgi:hypothetical protein